ncbi:hypothetical protein FCULG_00012414 [Fusarium culmorum]|uniref:Rhodopsin domain-containing protein n=1 Tax=Fusarium culmorum TaxID=5516 RepID=A0A2T4GRE8_FUSCU|nr:hypothetical protein FCULG_00012414 [Fusarium culmorum]
MEENESNRLSPLTPDDHAGKLWIVTILSLIYTLHVAVARVYIKYRMLGVDDALYGVAVLLHLGQSVAMFVGLCNGLGKKNSITTPERWVVSSKAWKSEPFCIGLMVTTVLWGVTSSVSFLINCNPGSVLTVENLEQCPHQVRNLFCGFYKSNKRLKTDIRWLSIASLDIVTELLTLALIVQLVWSVNIGHSRKWQVVAAFSFRLPLIGLSGVHVAYANKFPLSDEPQFAVTKALLWQQIMVSWSLLSATSPNLRSFMSSFNIGWGFPVAFDETNLDPSDPLALQELGKISCSAVTTSTLSSVASVSSSERPGNWRPDVIAHQATITHESDTTYLDDITEEEISRTGSHEMIINKEVTWNVTYEDSRC